VYQCNNKSLPYGRTLESFCSKIIHESVTVESKNNKMDNNIYLLFFTAPYYTIFFSSIVSLSIYIQNVTVLLRQQTTKSCILCTNYLFCDQRVVVTLGNGGLAGRLRLTLGMQGKELIKDLSKSGCEILLLYFLPM